MKLVKITVIKKGYNPELADLYLTEGKGIGPCPLLNEGDVFEYVGNAIMPEKFCPWAWIDLFRNISAISEGASFYPWNGKGSMKYFCCTDGLRPVVFKIEAEEND